MGRKWLCWCLAATLFAGCQTLRFAQRDTPFEHQFVREQLVVHSDFHLDENERLIDELVAEREWVASKLLLPATEVPIHVYLYANDHDYYDFLELRFPGFPSRRAIFVETSTELSVYAHWSDRVAEDLRHEVSHGYLHAAVPNLPLWLDEGLAEYFEVGVARHGLNQAHVELLQQKIAAGDWRPDITRLERLTSAALMTQADYAESWAWVHFLLESGDGKDEVLTDYLADLRQGATGAELSTRVSKRLAGPELALVEHLDALR
jgi:hypothetical protein